MRNPSPRRFLAIALLAGAAWLAPASQAADGPRATSCSTSAWLTCGAEQQQCRRGSRVSGNNHQRWSAWVASVDAAAGARGRDEHFPTDVNDSGVIVGVSFNRNGCLGVR